MTYFLNQRILLLLVFSVFFGCSTTKRKGELSKFQKFYHNTTSKYNGYFNAKELLNESILALEESNEDNYDELLDVFAYQTDNPEVAFDRLDRAIEKVSTVVSLHRYSKWVDDCYLLLGQAQHLKQDYETAEESFRFFQEEFEATNLYPTNTVDPRKSKREQDAQRKAQERKEREIERKEIAEERAESRKEKEEARKDDKKAREKQKKAEDKLRKEIKDLRDDLRKATKKRKDKEKKEREKARKNKKRLPPKDPNKDYRSDKEKTLEAEIADAQNELAIMRGIDDKKDEEEKPEETPAEDVVEEEGAINEATGESEEEEAEAEEESKKKKKTDEGLKTGKYKHKPAYYEGLLWLARTYAERGNGFSAEYILNNLNAETLVFDHVKDQLPASYAHLFIKQEEYKRATAYLQEAIGRSDDKHDKARYAYIMGQLYERDGNPTEALAAFKMSQSYKPKYEMSFHAALKQITLSHQNNLYSQDQALKKLDRMYRDDKNAEYGSQIKMAIGEIYLEAGNLNEAIANFQTALSQSGIKANKKSELYYKLASLCYQRENYLDASLYYDSTLAVIDKENAKYFEVEKRAKNLKAVAANLQIIQSQDSLLTLATMSPEEQRAIAEAEYERLLAEGRVAENQDEAKPFAELEAAINNFRKVGGGSSFFVYNPVSKNQGQRDFKRKWGNRVLEDNWRRSERIDASIANEEVEEDIPDEAEDDAAKEGEIKRLLANIPNSSTRKNTVQKKLEKAKFDLGVAYRNDVEDLNKSIETLEELQANHPNIDNRAEVYYYLYLNFLDLKNASKADQYANKLKSEFPNSEYAKILFDSDYIQAFEEEQNAEELTYQRAYAAFEAEKYDVVLATEQEAILNFGAKNDLAPKYALLSAMSTGNIEGKDAYIKALKSLTKKYPNTPEQVRAREILRFLDGKGDAFTTSKVGEEDAEAFKLEDDKLHYGIIVCYDINDEAMRNTKIDISDYNKNYFKLDKLKITDIYLNRDDKTQVILVRKFRNREKADLFYNSIKNKNAEFIKTGIEYEYYVITQKNYREVLKQKSVVNYSAWFNENYLGN